MQRKILIAVDASIHSRNALDYALQVNAQLIRVDFVLVNIQPIISQYLLAEALKRPKAKAELDKVYEENRLASEQLLEDLRKRMIDKGIDPPCVEIKTQPRSDGIAADIVNCAEAGAYDAILVGRRGVSGLQELFMGSVTSNLLAGSKVIPVWIVDGVVKSSRILIAVDGSPISLRAVDHVAFMLSENRQVTLEFLNIQPRVGEICEIDPQPGATGQLEQALMTSNEKCIADFSAVATGILKKAGFDDTQIVFRSEKKKILTGKAIVEILKKEDFGTVVIGKSGAGRNSHFGSVAGHVIQKAADRAIWIVP
ncbi:MAG: universal stress protein [Thermodesulfobacteriota bacterium]|nr:universal stress protein [Thermodesulfobacteriota bacterium]